MDKVIDLLQNIDNKLTHEHDYSILLSSNKSDFTVHLNPPLQLDSNKWSVGLISLETYNSIPNITKKNNTFKYSTDSGTTWKTIKLMTGSYEIRDIDKIIREKMRKNGDRDSIIIDTDFNLLKTVIDITNKQVRVDFTIPNSFRTLLGFDSIVLSGGTNLSQNITKILPINSVLVNCDIIKNSYLNSNCYPVLYSFFPKSEPGFKIIQDPVNVVYLPVNSNYIQNIRIWLTDQDGDIIDFRGETITCRLNFKKI